MKTLLLLALCAAATIDANAATTQDGQTPSTTMTSKQQRKAARQAKAPQVYKGTVAERSRIVTDAAGAENEPDGDGRATKSSKKEKIKK